MVLMRVMEEVEVAVGVVCLSESLCHNRIWQQLPTKLINQYGESEH